MRKKLFSLLVLLMVAVTGAWAQEETLLTTITPTGDDTYSETTAGAVTVTPAGSFFYSGSSYGWRWDSYGSLTVTANEGYTITRCVFIQQGKNQSVTISEAPFALNFEELVCLENYSMDGVSSIEVYGYAPAEPVASWVGNSAINANGTWYYAGSNFGWCTGGAFNGADLGTITTLSLGGQSQAWADGNANWNDGNLTMTMGYKIDGGADESLSLNWCEFADNNNKFQSGGSSWAAQDIDISGLTPGNHTIAVWFTRDDKWDSNNSANYVANFTIPTPAATTYTVSVKEGTADAEKWSADPNPAEAGQTVTVTYSGLKKVKSVKAVKKAASAEPEPAAPTLAQTMTTADMTVKVKYIHSDEENYCQFLSKGDGTYTFQSGDGWVGGDGSCAKALVVEGGKLVFKQNTYSDIDYDWNFCGFSVTFDTINNTYSEWRGLYAANEETPPSFISVEVNGTTISLTAAPAAAEGHPLSASEVGEIVCSDGLAYAAADKDNLPTGVTAVAIVAYLGDGDTSDNTYNNGLAIAMSNANDGSGCGWGDYFVSYNCVSKSNDIATAIGYKDGISSTNTLTSDGHYHEAATAAVSNNGTAAPTGTSGWFLPSMGQWNLIVQGLASKKAGSAVTTDISTSGNDTYTASNLNSVITDAGGTGFNGGYQSSTQYDSDDCWHMDISSGRASNYVFYAGDYVRSVLAF